MRRLRLLALLAVPAIFAVLALTPGCTKVADPWPPKPGPRVLVSFAPLYCFAANVAGDDANVLSVMAESGPHEFDPSPRDAAAVKRADLFVINGLDLDNQIARKMTRNAGRTGLKIVEAASAISKKDLIEGVCNCGDHHAHESADHEHIDPQVWLGIPEAIQVVGKIRDELKEKDPAHAEGYDRRAEAYIQKLDKLLADGRAMIKSKKERKLLSFHDSLRYFARAFDLEIVDSIQSSPGSEPDARTLSELVKTCREKNVRVIAVEPQYDANTAAKTILRELRDKKIDAQFVTIDPIETAATSALTPDYYELKMRENLRLLAETLK